MAVKLPDRVHQKHGAFYLVANNKWTHLGRTLAEMYRSLADLHADAATPGTMDELIARYVREIVPGKAEASQREDRRRAILLRAVFGAESPENIRPKDVARFLRPPDGPSTGKVELNRQKALLSHVFTMGMEWGVVDFNPCLGVKRNKERPRDRYPEHHEVEAVGKYLQPAWAVRCIRLAYLIAQRPGDVVRTAKAQIQSDGFYYRQRKTGKKLLIEWSPALRSCAEDCLQHSGDLMLFARQVKGQWRPYTMAALSSAWKRAMAKALKAGDLLDPFQMRDLRPKSGTDAKDPELLGNTDAVRRRHYLNRKPQRVRPVA